MKTQGWVWNASPLFVLIVKYAIPLCLLGWQIISVIQYGVQPVFNLTMTAVALFLCTRGEIYIAKDSVRFRRFWRSVDYTKQEIVGAIDSAIPLVDVLVVRRNGKSQELHFLNHETHPAWRSTRAVGLLNSLGGEEIRSGVTAAKETQHELSGWWGALAFAAGILAWVLVRPIFSPVYDQLPAAFIVVSFVVAGALTLPWIFSAKTRGNLVLLLGAGTAITEGTLQVIRFLR